MAEILTQDEIDALLSAISTGDDDGFKVPETYGVSYKHKERAESIYEESRKEIEKEKSLKERKEMYKRVFIHHVSRFISEIETFKEREKSYAEDVKRQEEAKEHITSLLKITLEQLKKI